MQLRLNAVTRRVKAMNVRRPNCQARYVPRCPDRLLFAPQDLRTADPIIAEDIYAGIFVFSGQVENCDTHSPFLVRPPSAEWERELHGFRWLRHLRASEATTTRSNAQVLVENWIAHSSKLSSTAWELPVVAERVFAWLNNSPLILQDADHDFYRAFLRALYLQVRFLRASHTTLPNNADRLHVLMAELAGWLCFEGKERLVRSASKRLDGELDVQILPDGGHLSRNPLRIVSILLDLLPIRQTFLSRDLLPPEGMNRAIERMMPMLRFFRHPNGTFAHFNGAGATPVDQIATILAYDDIRGAPVSNATFSGYQRLEASSTVLLMDTGSCPPIEQSSQAHAGTLSFELSVGAAPMIINCGAPSNRHVSWRELARGTAAHSTLTIQDRSTCTIASQSFDLGGRPLLCAPLKIKSDRVVDQGQEAIIASHEGYGAHYGIRHERTIWMAIDGRRLDGQDSLASTGKGIKKAQDSFALRFHLHPSVQFERAEEGDIIYLGLLNGEIWKFEAREIEPTIEDSVFLSDIHGIQPAKQLVLYGYASHTPTIRWHFERVAVV